MSTGWETTINTGNPQTDQQTVQAWQQSAASQGMVLQVTPLPTGGLHVKAVPMGQAQPSQPQPQQGYGAPQPQPQQQQGYGAQPQQQQGYGAPQQQQGYGGGGVFAAAGAAMSAPPSSQPWNANANAGLGAAPGALGQQRLTYLRKVYGLLGGSALTAIIVGGLVTSSVFGVETFESTRGPIEVPVVVATMLQNQVLMLVAFGVLFVSTFIASWVSKIKGVNIAALFGVGALMGLDLAPMVWVASVLGDLGMSMSASPVRDAGVMTMSVFAGITGYVFVTKKDFSYLRGFLSMATMALFALCILAGVFGSEAFSLAVAGIGSVISMAMLLYVTSFIFRNSEMDDPVGDALALLVQLRNLFMFLLRIFMSSRD
ncbi:MAG: Bax inhibitor-1 family protein [Deltaproteobacteria bacterium]|nr:Bax inhibitor-1 family protein [Deltaproteobacteria bacterium]